MKKKLIMASLVVLSFTSCIPLAVVGGAAVGAGAAIATPVIVKKIKEKKSEKDKERNVNYNERGVATDEVGSVIK